MKKFKISSVVSVVSVVIILLLFFYTHNWDKITEKTFTEPRSGVAIIMTGAAARIPQEAALLEELDKRGLLKDLVFISGASSGALNSVVLNGILSKKISWDDYKNILYGIKNEDIFEAKGKKLPVNTLPARNLYRNLVENRLGYNHIGDLPFYTSISLTRSDRLLMRKKVYRMCSRKINEESDTTLNLVDLMMATSAIPIVFPRVKIKNVSTIPDVEFLDGGVGEDQVPFHALLEFEKFRGIGVEKVYIISRGYDSIPKVRDELNVIGIDDRGICDKMGISIDNYLGKRIHKKIKAFSKQAPSLIPRTWVWIPELDSSYLLFDFNKLKDQYELTSEWAKTHPPIPLENYLNKQN